MFNFRKVHVTSYACVILDASTLYLNGSQQMTALMPEDSKTQAEELVIRFKTTKPRGLLLATSLENSIDRLQISLEDGCAKALIHIDHQQKVRFSLNIKIIHFLYV